MIWDRKVLTTKAIPLFEGRRVTLGDVIERDVKKIDPSYFIPTNELAKWRYLKGAKSLKRIKKNGVEYSYDEGAISFPDLQAVVGFPDYWSKETQYQAKE